MKISPCEAESRIFDICIIGAGPAGITIALEYERLRPSSSILLLEFGYRNMLKHNALDDSIEIQSEGNHHDPYECTNKGLGGSSATWGGRCVMYDEIDFIPRQVISENCTWDKNLLDELRTHVLRTSEVLECGKGCFDLAEDPQQANARIAEGFVSGEVTDTIIERWSMPTRFNRRYRRELENSRAICLMEGWQARSLGVLGEGGDVKKIELLKTGAREKLVVQAKKFVLSAGAQESTRLLLQNPQVFSSIGGAPDALGRYYQSHLSGKIATVCFTGNPKKTDYGFIRDADGSYMRRRFQFPASVLSRENLLNTAMWLDNPLYLDPAHRSGAMSFMYLAMIAPFLGRRLAPPAIAQAITKNKVFRVPAHLFNIFKDLPHSLWAPACIFFKRYCLKRKLPGVFLYSPNNRYALHFHAEQTPVRDNRMELGTDGETLVIRYNLFESDIQSVIKCHELLDQWLKKCGCGYLEYWYPKERLEDAIRQNSKDGIHQSGTTRIAASPDMGVVDRDLKVFGTRNLFVCSSSVFPTSSQANPTFFMCVFAVRLAQKLAAL